MRRWRVLVVVGCCLGGVCDIDELAYVFDFCHFSAICVFTLLSRRMIHSSSICIVTVSCDSPPSSTRPTRAVWIIRASICAITASTNTTQTLSCQFPTFYLSDSLSVSVSTSIILTVLCFLKCRSEDPSVEDTGHKRSLTGFLKCLRAQVSV